MRWLAKSLPKGLAGDLTLYAESFEHAREAFPQDSLVSPSNLDSDLFAAAPLG